MLPRPRGPCYPPPMSRALQDLIQCLRPVPAGGDLFDAPSQDLGWGAIFGGQALAQCIAAAVATLPDDRPVHSLHANFLRPGRGRDPVRYEVERQRDGQSFSVRRVVGKQGDAAIISASVSFQRAERGLDHQDELPQVPSPEGLESELDLARRWAADLPESLRSAALRERSIEVRPTTPQNPLRPVHGPPRRSMWLRATGPLPDDDALHRVLLAYASDFNFLGASLQPHGLSWLSGGMQMTSLDHAIWFHRPVRMDQWVLFDVESPSASGSRGFVRGRLFQEDGALVATVAQEGLIRQRS